MKSKLILTALISFLLTEIGAKTTEDTSLQAQTLDVGTANLEETYAPALKPEMTSRQDETWNELTERSLQSCSSTHNGANDAYGDTCTWYANYPDSCGRYDDADFRAASMCCECGGGSGSSSIPDEKACFDTNGSSRDSGGDDCTWYDEGNSNKCGDYDDSNFNANSDCCACGGGVDGTYRAPTDRGYSSGCADTNHGARDAGYDTCEWYATNFGSCGSYDDDDFSASSMCCYCDGGSTGSGGHTGDTESAIASETAATCTDRSYGALDAGGDNCGWYAANFDKCGSFDDWDFQSNSMCCECRFGSECADTSNGNQDAYGDTCEWYSDHVTSCGAFDHTNFQAQNMCCVCGGGSGGASSYRGRPTVEEVCFNTDLGVTDNSYDGCEWYSTRPSSCGDYDDDDFSAKEMCCGCGGGSDTETVSKDPTEKDSEVGDRDILIGLLVWLVIFISCCGLCCAVCVFIEIKRKAANDKQKQQPTGTQMQPIPQHQQQQMMHPGMVPQGQAYDHQGMMMPPVMQPGQNMSPRMQPGQNMSPRMQPGANMAPILQTAPHGQQIDYNYQQ